MKVRPFFLAILIFKSVELKAQSLTSYRVQDIPEQLLKGAATVVRDASFQIEIKDQEHVVYKYLSVITVLHMGGQDRASLLIHYNPWNQIRKISGTIYNARGEVIQQIKNKDFKDQHAVDGFSFFTDTRYKTYQPGIQEYPFTIKYEYEISDRNSIAFPAWYPQTQEGVSVQKSRFSIIANSSFPVRYMEHHCTGNFRDSIGGKFRIMEWSAANLQALRRESFSPPLSQILAQVKIAPRYFIYEGIAGEFSNWKEYGRWTYQNLLQGRDAVSVETSDKIAALVKDAASDQEKIKRIYTYVQKKTRYVNVQLGTGGIVPMKASDVDAQGYGDCKALVNYTSALLKAAGITSYYAELYEGREIRYLDDEFASMEGNHVLLCVPLENDTIWLECTSKTAPCGFLGINTGNRNALLCTPVGGFIVRTKKYSAEQNSISTKTFLTIDSGGNLDVKMDRKFMGIYLMEKQVLLETPRQNRKMKLQDLYPSRNLNIASYDILPNYQEPMWTEEHMEFAIKKYAVKREDMLLVPIDVLQEKTSIPEDLQTRMNNVFIGFGFSKIYETEITIPEGYVAEHLPKNIHLQNEVGNFQLVTEYTDGKVFCKIEWTLNEGTFPPESYKKLLIFFRESDFSGTLKIGLQRKKL